MTAPTFPALVPVLVVDDIPDAISFYGLLGFTELEGNTFLDAGGRPVHAHLEKDGSVLFLGVADGASHYPGHSRVEQLNESTTANRCLGVTLIVQTEDLTRLYQAVAQAGAEILHEPTDEWYGDRVLLFLDPFGYEWKASQPLAGP